jgi:hypothetical protein
MVERGFPGAAPQMTDQFRRELTTNMLYGFWALSLDALVEFAGKGRSIELLRPHMENSGRGGYRFLMTRMGWEEESLERVAIITAMAHMLMGKKVRAARVKGEEEMVVEFVECPFESASLEVCVGICYHIIRGVAEEYGSDYEGELFKMMKHGDPFCAKGVVRKGVPPSAAPWKDLEYSIDFMSQEERDFFFNAYITEFWYDGVKAFNDLRDERSTLSVLAPRMKAFGMSTGLQAARELGLGQGRTAAAQLIGLVHRCLGQETDIVEGASVDAVTRSCPFAGAPSPACQLFGSFLEGMVQVVHPAGGLSYRPDTDGNETKCTWTLS